jgi:hypothetical protein
MRDTKRSGLRYIAVACLFAALTMLWALAAFSISTRPRRDVMNQRLLQEHGAVLLKTNNLPEPPVVSQTRTPGSAAGTVTDASGAVVSTAKVTIHLAGANETRSVVANATGECRFSLLTPHDLHGDRGSHRLEIHNRRIVTTGCGVPFQRAVNG